ncbi:hypothetical protein L4174_023830 (plasmid) [Photobacterium sp. CCB-ST2H9]|uniref:hypothetical protein n=1 Tax=Photobacterium sp. CCB-ST2H9 TaxID=2912855 RepID=UPI0020065569|nr:hypothetical protein [Photobacterium sp. CCB-ST2H9]UTM60417.1 hypothetical protein L4174_023830 [Photobacterium sp. CCB-ST2H9]
MDIPYTLSNVAETVIYAINADGTMSAGSAGNQAIFAGIVISRKGRPYEPIAVTKSNYEALLGKAYHPSKGLVAEPMRHLAEAVDGGPGIIVRVVPGNAKTPVIRVKVAENGSPTVENDALPFETAITLDEAGNEKIAFYINDGDALADRSVEMKIADENKYGSNKYELLLYRKDTAGNDGIEKRYIVGLDPEATDDQGGSAYLEAVLEDQNAPIRAIVGDITSIKNGIPRTQFTGGEEGDLNTISPENYKKALSALSSSLVKFTHVLGLGCYDNAVIKGLIDISNKRRIGGFYDVNPRLSYADACKAKKDMAINEHRACFYHFPFDAKDPTYKVRAVWGLSGVAFRAKSIGIAKTAPTGGYHYTPAGEERAIISRTALRQRPNAGEPDYELMYEVRINKIGTTEAGYLMIDDSLTSSVRENDLRFEQIVSVTDAVSRDAYVLANRLKHEPDGVTYDGAIKGMKRILEGYVSIGALVPPTDKETDGEEPYKLMVDKLDKDLWRLRYALCVSGSARRFACEPIVIH